MFYIVAISRNVTYISIYSFRCYFLRCVVSFTEVGCVCSVMLLLYACILRNVTYFYNLSGVTSIGIYVLHFRLGSLCVQQCYFCTHVFSVRLLTYLYDILSGVTSIGIYVLHCRLGSLCVQQCYFYTHIYFP
jgi:hypothetical protein